jgi:hypothetical protein
MVSLGLVSRIVPVGRCHPLSAGACTRTACPRQTTTPLSILTLTLMVRPAPVVIRHTVLATRP